MKFSQHLVLWLHVAFVVFTIGPVTLAIMSTPRYIRHGDVRIVRYLSRITFIFTLGSLAVLIAGEFLAQMLSVSGKPWVIISTTLFVVAVVLLLLIVRDQRKAIRALEAEAAGAPAGAPSTNQLARTASSPAEQPTAEPTSEGSGEPTGSEAPMPAASPAAAHVASVERGRIAMMGGVVSLIWLVILVFMVWNG